ncbi:SNF2-related protein [Flavobacterium psychrophilum]
MLNLLPQQIEVKTKHLTNKAGALFMKPGTGKTRPTIELVNSVKDVDLVVWVGPLRSIKPKDGLPSIIDEINKWGGFNCQNVVYMGIETLQSSDRAYLQLYKQISTAWRCFLVVDESIKMKNFDAKRTQRMLTLSQMVEYKLILNGTPITKNLLDLWSQIHFLSPLILRMDYAEFKNTFLKYTTITKHLSGRKSYTKEFITGIENIPYLYSLIGEYIFECDLNLDIKQVWNNYNYILCDENKQEYEELKTKFLDNKTLEEKNNNIFLEMTQKMQHIYCCTPNKFEVLREHFKKWPEEKHIIFCKFIKSQEEVKKAFPKATVLSYQKESMSLNLQNYPYTIFWDKNFDWGLREQGTFRNYRTGNLEDCYYWDMTGDVGLEVLFDKNVSAKTNMVDYFKKVGRENLKEIL